MLFCFSFPFFSLKEDISYLHLLRFPICPFPLGWKKDFYFIFILINEFELQVVKQLMFIFKRQWKGKSSSLTWQKKTVCSLLMPAWKMTAKGVGVEFCVLAGNRCHSPESREVKMRKLFGMKLYFPGKCLSQGMLSKHCLMFMVHWSRIKFPRNKIAEINSIAWTLWLIKSTTSLSSFPFQLGKANNNLFF